MILHVNTFVYGCVVLMIGNVIAKVSIIGVLR